MQAISVLGREVMLPRGLVGLGLDTLDHSGPEIAQVIFSIMSLSPAAKNTLDSGRPTQPWKFARSRPLHPGERPHWHYSDPGPADTRGTI